MEELIVSLQGQIQVLSQIVQAHELLLTELRFDASVSENQLSESLASLRGEIDKVRQEFSERLKIIEESYSLLKNIEEDF